jgi:outer membrane phospholipase A
LIILILLVSISVNAQTSKIKFGVKSGMNLSKYTPEMYLGNTRISDYQGKLGFYIGGFTNIKISDKFKIQPELLFSNQGTKRVFEDVSLNDSNLNTIATGDIEYKINESVISLPITLQYFITNKFNFEGGIQLGYIINRKEEITKNPFEQFLGDNSINNNVDYDKFDLGFNLGLGYNLLENVRINTRYFLGLIERDNSIKPTVFSLGIEYEI